MALWPCIRKAAENPANVGRYIFKPSLGLILRANLHPERGRQEGRSGKTLWSLQMCSEVMCAWHESMNCSRLNCTAHSECTFNWKLNSLRIQIKTHSTLFQNTFFSELPYWLKKHLKYTYFIFTGGGGGANKQHLLVKRQKQKLKRKCKKWNGTNGRVKVMETQAIVWESEKDLSVSSRYSKAIAEHSFWMQISKIQETLKGERITTYQMF